MIFSELNSHCRFRSFFLFTLQLNIVRDFASCRVGEERHRVPPQREDKVTLMTIRFCQEENGVVVQFVFLLILSINSLKLTKVKWIYCREAQMLRL